MGIEAGAEEKVSATVRSRGWRRGHDRQRGQGCWQDSTANVEAEGGDGREAADDGIVLEDLAERWLFHSLIGCCNWPQFLLKGVLFCFVWL